ncbi:MAG TPA: NAD(P)-dependent oxidoreductase, partial [Dehalococcoidia bacterium]|nr:NAD(P)-dependent oxidoreductase [Dehalococcoidia bacterium]
GAVGCGGLEGAAIGAERRGKRGGVAMGAPRVFVAARLTEQYLALLQERCEVTVRAGSGIASRNELLEELKEAEGLLGPAILPLDAEVLESAPRLRVISNIGVGYDNVDLECAARRGIVVANTPGILSDAVAELTMALMLMLARRLPESVSFVREGQWGRPGAALPFGSDLAGKTLTVIGMGRIGREVTRRALVFGMRVVYFDVVPVVDTPEGAFAAADLEAALGQADLVSPHTNLTRESHQMIGARELRMMKLTASLINTARGPIVDQGALYEALVAGEIAAAALDVLEEEPPAADDPLLGLPNVIVTPHIGTATVETR